MYRNRGKRVYFVAGALIFTFIQAVFAQNTQKIYYKYCVARPDTDCFNPVNGAVDTVGRNVAELGGGYRFCLKNETADAGFAPVRVVLVLDKSYSMCQNPSGGVCCTDGDGSLNCMMNDPTDMRVQGAQLFVDSLAAKSPNSQVGVITFDQTVVIHNLIVINTPANLQQVKDWIYEASCVATGYNTPQPTPTTTTESTPAPYGLGKTSAIKVTCLGLGLQSGLSAVDYNYSSIHAMMKRHIILLTDGSWDDVFTRSPQMIVDQYKAQYADREVPVFHGVFLSNQELHMQHSYPPEGCSNTDPVILTDFQQATTLGDTIGFYFAGSTPQTVVDNFVTLFSRMIRKVEPILSGMIVTNTTNGNVRNHTVIRKVCTDTGSVHYYASIDNLPLEFGLNTLTVQRIVQNPGTQTLDTATSRVFIYRTSTWTSSIIQNAYDLHCVKDSMTVSISVTPPVLLVNNSFTLKSTITLKEKFILDTVEVRIFTQFPDADPSTVGVFHLERDLTNSTNGSDGTGSTAGFSETDALFGNSVLNQGSFSTTIATIPADFALEAWIKPSNAGGKTDIFSGSGFSFGIEADRILYFITDGIELSHAAVAVDADTWSHVAVSRVSGNLIIFINGVNVSQPIQYTGVLTGAITVSCPVNGVLDEVRISRTNRMRPDPRFLIFDIPMVQKPTWTLAGQSVTQPVLTVSPDKWNWWKSGDIEFQFTSPVSGRLIVNFQHKGIDSETQWSKNGNPVFSAADLNGPYVARAFFTTGPIGESYDTLRVIFSEPVRCDSLKKSLDPSTSFKIYGPGNTFKENAFEDAVYRDANNCPAKYIVEAIIITSATVNGIIPKRDSILLVGAVVDTAGNHPDTTRRRPIEYSPDSSFKIISSNRGHSLPTSFDFSYNSNASVLHIAIPTIAGTPSVPVRIQLFDIRGRLLAILLNEEMQPGYYKLRLQSEKNIFASSCTICRMDAKGFFCRIVKVVKTK